MTQEESHPKVSVSISPAVIFSIGEIYQRRNDSGPSRIVGALFGSSEAGTVQGFKISANQCFVVPHSEVADQISINSEYYKQRLELHKKCFGNDSSIVGWFSVTQDGTLVSEKNTQFINDSFGREVAQTGNSPYTLHLNIHISNNGYIEKNATITSLSSKSVFTPQLFSVDFKPNETLAVHAVVQASGMSSDDSAITLPSEVQFVEKKVQELKEQIAQLREYQKKIASGEFKTEKQVQNALDESLLKLSTQLTQSNPRLENEISALRQVCESIKSQVQILDEMVTYQPYN